MNFVCKSCDYNTSNKKDYNKHLHTAKHINRTQLNEKSPKIPKSTIYCCDICNKQFNARNSLWYHKKKCNTEFSYHTETIEIPTETERNRTVIELLKQNQEFKELIVEQNKQIMELVQKPRTRIKTIPR